MSYPPELSASLGASTDASESESAVRWKRLMTSDHPSNEHLYLSPSFTRTPTPPMIFDSSADAPSSSQTEPVLRTSQEFCIPLPVREPDYHVVDADVRVLFFSNCAKTSLIFF